ncbi:class I poly(R)-hydroxyalkanoic acid synthase [Sphingomonas sp.]|jgi:polyhydroxyalkanoate synthase|uniref:PHA/PHB synthase family protein n=1 Tax=Sphingomonas sp. TaxID=28214 RepID=UPI002D80BAFA|nr:class I poly(R)-hydroxyalkanoic acid synthase [Sphingomonas sp.]HEU0045612.1 class I poly(R)-hydroxyalkanoic acid synthase [Sphingomonas sp.]
MADAPTPPTHPMQWLQTVGAEQEKLLERAIATMKEAGGTVAGVNDPETVERVGQFWRDGLQLWQRFLTPAEPVAASKDKRFKDEAWSQPGFAAIRQAYDQASAALMGSIDKMDGVDEPQRERLRFTARMLADAMSPSNFPLTNPQVLQRTVETGGQNLVKGMQNMLADMGKGQLTHTAPDAFELGRNLATTPGKVVKRTPLYELIQYAPTTERVLATPLVIFPPWINRFYILDLTPEKSFIRWAVEQGLTVFMVSWKSADASHKEVKWDDYVAAQVEAIDTVRDLLGVPAAHAIGYCVAGTTLAATLAVETAKGAAEKVRSATFFTAQVDFSDPGELKHFVDDRQMELIAGMSTDGYVDGRVMAATFNLLRGRDLIWNYVTNHYLLGEEYPAFDLLHWNGDTTNLPAAWHQSYLKDLYRDNLLIEPGRLSVNGTPIDLTKVETPTYVQAGREDHIAPAESVWKITHLFRGPLRFVLAGSGHIAGVVNPPAAGKYQYWTNDARADTLAEFVAGASETKGSWWPDWIGWLRGLDADEVAADGARVPGAGALPALGEAPGEYVRAR